MPVPTTVEGRLKEFDEWVTYVAEHGDFPSNQKRFMAAQEKQVDGLQITFDAAAIEAISDVARKLLPRLPLRTVKANLEALGTLDDGERLLIMTAFLYND